VNEPTIIASRLIDRSKAYLEAPSRGYWLYETWIEDEEELAPGVSKAIRAKALELIHADDRLLARSAIQALACVGMKVDVSELELLASSADPELSFEAQTAARYIVQRAKTIEELLAEVDSRASFLVFVEALAKERLRAEKLERADSRPRFEGELGWQNGDISSFLFAAMSGLHGSSESTPSWKTLAKFLYFGKIIE
jgi:hypothetical protein